MKKLKENMADLLASNLTDEEKQTLKDTGFKIKRPNKYTLIALALYKKAVGGDLSAIKEIRSVLGDTGIEKEVGVVKIIDDIGS